MYHPHGQSKPAVGNNPISMVSEHPVPVPINAILEVHLEYRTFDFHEFSSHTHTIKIRIKNLMFYSICLHIATSGWIAWIAGIDLCGV